MTLREHAGDPRWDTLVVLFSEVCRAAVRNAFDEPSGVRRYQGWLADPSRDTPVFEFATFGSVTGGKSVLLARAAPNEFALVVTHRDFHGFVAFRYCPVTGLFSALRVVQFLGCLEGAARWMLRQQRAMLSGPTTSVHDPLSFFSLTTAKMTH